MGELVKTPKAPVLPPPAPMPEKAAPDVEAAKKRAAQAAASRKGRGSTIMTDYGEKKETVGSNKETLG